MALRVVSWNLKHGRAVPPANRDLFAAFAAALAGWAWDVALLQEVPPWWPSRLGPRCRAEHRLVLTSRNFGLIARRPLATRWPDLMKSNGGGANAILIRGAQIAEHRRQRLCRWPERRWLHAVRVAGGGFQDGAWVGNLHATAHDTAAAVRDSAGAAAALRAWAGGRPVVLGGDFNLRDLRLGGFAHAGGHDVDHVFARGLQREGNVELLPRGRLSDHAPVAVTLEPGD